MAVATTVLVGEVHGEPPVSAQPKLHTDHELSFRHRERSVAILDCRAALAMTSPGLLPDLKVHGELSVSTPPKLHTDP